MSKPCLHLLPACLLLAAACKDTSPAVPATPTAPTATRIVPYANFNLPATTEVGQALVFDNQSQNATAYKWYFGDGGTSQAASPSHTYASVGSYTVTLHAYSSTRDSATTSKTVQVTPPNLFATTAPTIIPGTYDCRVYRNGVRQPDATLLVKATGPQTLTIDDDAGTYFSKSGNLVIVRPVPAPYYAFSMKPVGFLDGSAAFHSGDSLIYSKYVVVGHGNYSTTWYQGRRRP